jgi:hypothetical protein
VSVHVSSSKFARKQNGLPSKSPSGSAVSKSGNAGSLAGISILSSLAVGIVYQLPRFASIWHTVVGYFEIW